MKVLIAIPARNEEKRLGSVLDRIGELYPDFPVLVVDDASSDSTWSILENRPRVTAIRLPFWMGYGGALQTAYKYSLQ